MGLSEGAALIFISLLPRVTLNSFTLVLSQQAQLGWLYLLINGLVVLFMAFLLVYIHSKIKGDLFAVTSILLGKKAACLIMGILIVVFGGNAVLLIRQYAENTLITAMPGMDVRVSILVYTLSALAVTYFGASGITRCSIIFMPLMIISFLAVTLLLYPFYIPYQLLPWQGNGLAPCFVQGIKGAGYNAGFLALFLFAPSFQNIKTLRHSLFQGIVASVLLKAYMMVIFIMVFGVAVGSEKTMPFFELARLIYLGRFFQHLEAFFIVTWVILGALAIAINFFMVNYLLGRALDLPMIRPLMPCMAMLMCNLALLPEDINKTVQLDTKFILMNDLAIFVIPILLLAALWIKQRKGFEWGKSA